MNIILPIAGLGSRFVNAGYQIPKPFIPVQGKTMVEHVIENIAMPEDNIFIITSLDHFSYLRSTNLLHKGNIAFIPEAMRLGGAASATLVQTKNFINNNEPLIIANGDQWVRYDKQAFREAVTVNDGTILTFNADSPKWSYAVLDDDNNVSKVAEKIVLSEHATVGIYGFKHGKYFVQAAEQMINKDIKTNGEFYICPVYNELIANQLKVKAFPVDEMFGMGTPEDLELSYNFIGR